MGEVYRARHGMMRRPTAIKLLRPDQGGEVNLARFEREVQLTARLTHPNTITIFDYGRTHDGVFYYAMELLDGATLQRIVAEGGAQPPGRVVRILSMVCGALAEAHAIGLMHRDIKPANIMLCTQGGERDVVKLLDFGLVKEFKVGRDVKLTGESVVIGTPQYMAPECILNPDSWTPARTSTRWGRSPTTCWRARMSSTASRWSRCAVSTCINSRRRLPRKASRFRRTSRPSCNPAWKRIRSFGRNGHRAAAPDRSVPGRTVGSLRCLRLVARAPGQPIATSC